MQHKQQYIHHSHSNQRIYTGYQDNLTDRPRTTTRLQIPHKHTDPEGGGNDHSAGQHKRNQNKLEELKLLIHDTHADIITIQETRLTHKANTQKVHKLTTGRTDRLHKAGMGSSHSLQHTFLRPLIHTTQSFKWSWCTLTTLNTSQLQTSIYLHETAHQRTTKQLTWRYNTACIR